jgi:hypothetical protein
VNNNKNSLLFISNTLASYNNFVKEPPKDILLNINIVYAADNIIEEEARIPNKGSFSKIPYRDINSPIKFKVKGAPQLPKHSIKYKTENKGINCVIPL